jgi:3-hydroxyacyl-CoA dehydrogenase/enoyl-CoA hydratase/3-hydroxybutyryl-CoA epimerase
MIGAKLTQEGTPFNWVEESAVDFGMPIPPFEVLDEVGMDLAFKVADNLYKVLGERMQPPRIMYEIPRLGLVGKKTGKGAYLYDETGKKKEINPEVAAIEGVRLSPDKPDADAKLDIAHQLIFPMIDEAARCLEERIVMKPREIDMAIVYGIGFPPFRGGLLKYADKVGLQTVADGLRAADEKSANKRGLSELIRKYIEEGRGFYSRAGKEEE